MFRTDETQSDDEWEGRHRTTEYARQSTEEG